MSRKEGERMLNAKGIIAHYLLALLILLEVTGLALLNVQNSSINDSQNQQARVQAKFLAQSALQEAKYYVKTVSPGWTGSSPEQSVTINNHVVGSYEYTVAAVGNLYTITAKGYVPNKQVENGVSHLVTTSYSYPVAANPGLLVLHPTASNAIDASGSASLVVYGGKIGVNSSAASAITLAGSAVITAPEVGMVGNWTHGGSSSMTANIKTGASEVIDPLASLSAPSMAGLTVRSNTQYVVAKNTTAVMNPGLYNGGVSIAAGATVTMNPGLYYINGGGLTNSGNSVLTGNGVLIYNAPSNASEGISISGNGSVSLSPMSSGPYAGITIWQDRNSTAAASFSGNGSLMVSGVLYFAGAPLSIGGSSSVPNIGSLNISRTLSVSGNGGLTINNY